MPRHVHAKHCWLQKEFGTASVRRVSMKIVAAVKGINNTLVPSHFAFLYSHVGGNCKLSMLIFWYMTFQSRQLFTAFRITQLWTSPMWRDMSRQWQSLRANYWFFMVMVYMRGSKYHCNNRHLYMKFLPKKPFLNTSRHQLLFRVIAEIPSSWLITKHMLDTHSRIYFTEKFSETEIELNVLRQRERLSMAYKRRTGKHNGNNLFKKMK